MKNLYTPLLLLVMGLQCALNAQSPVADFSFSINCRTVTFTSLAQGRPLGAQINYQVYENGIETVGFSGGTLGLDTFAKWEFTNGNFRVLMYVNQYDTAIQGYAWDTMSKSFSIQCNDKGGYRCNDFSQLSYLIDPADCKKVRFSNHAPGIQSSRWYMTSVGYTEMKNPVVTFPGPGKYVSFVYTKGFDSLSNEYCRDSFGITVKITCDSCSVRAALGLDYNPSTPFQAIVANYSSGKINKHRWNFGDGNVSNAATPTHVYSITGPVTLTYIASDSISGCSDTTVFQFTIDSTSGLKRSAFTLIVADKTNTEATGIKSLAGAGKNLTVYPNPFRENIFIKAKDPIASPVIKMYDIRGIEVGCTVHMESGQYVIHPDTELATGFYCLKVISAESVHVYTLIRE